MKITCIACPQGCSINIKEDKGEIICVSGHGCIKGEKFAESEFYYPKRIVTTIVSLIGGEYSYLPVISDGQVPKDILRNCIYLLQRIEVAAPIKMRDIVVENILGTGINIIAAKAVRVGE
jgi:CxxC motif-containing protein